jgi:hypothetical protein
MESMSQEDVGFMGEELKVSHYSDMHEKYGGGSKKGISIVIYATEKGRLAKEYATGGEAVIEFYKNFDFAQDLR